MSRVAQPERGSNSVNNVETIFARRSIRQYLSRAVERERLLLHLQATIVV